MHLLRKEEIQEAVVKEINLDDGLGWVACCLGGLKRHKSIIAIYQIAGEIGERKVKHHRTMEFSVNISPYEFAERIFDECANEHLPDISIITDDNPFMGEVFKAFNDICARKDTTFSIQVVNWRGSCQEKAARSRFDNQRAQTHLLTGVAFRKGDIFIDDHPSTAKQAENIIVEMTQAGRWAIKKFIPEMPQERFDALCLTQIARYTPAYI